MKEQTEELAYFLTALDHIAKNSAWGWQNALSIDTRISEGYISQVINKTRKPSFDIQVKIAKSLGFKYIEFLEMGKRLINEGEQPSELAPFGKRTDISLAEIARQRDAPEPSRPAPDPLAASGKSPYEMLFDSLMAQINLAHDTIKEMKGERSILVEALKDDLARCRDELARQDVHILRLNDTLDKVNADIRRMQDRMLDAARTGDIHHLDQISDVG